jgi:glycosyltransferase involved in cell wall biosynthesis
MKKVVYITAKAPFGQLGETYILPEMLALKSLGVDLMIIPRDYSTEVFHKIASQLLDNTVSIPLFNVTIGKELLKFLLFRPIAFFKMLRHIVFRARTSRIAFKNLIVFPKAIFMSHLLKQEDVLHIHAHYGSTTSTMAYVISALTGIPWSFTVHRWDIPENNLLDLKCESAVFVRTIDQQGLDEVGEVVKKQSLRQKVRVIHVGINIDHICRKSETSPETFTILCPAMLVLKKGHKYLFGACSILKERNISLKCLVAGDGPLREDLRRIVDDLNLNGYVEFLGPLSQEQLFELYESGRVNLVVLPSIVAEDGQKEGIPVSLMEAMSYGIPVISTNTGGIPELLGDNNGIIIEEKNSHAIATSIEKLFHDRNYGTFIGKRGCRKVEQDFNISVISKQLLHLFTLPPA